MEKSNKARGEEKKDSSKRPTLEDECEVGDIIKEIADVQVGMRLEAMDKFGKWYVAKVIEVDEDDGDVLVHFDRWSSRYDEYILINSGQLRCLHPTRLEKLNQERAKARKALNIGDRVQAKWEDGRMYYGKVLRIHSGEADILFDDGVEYTAPLSNVRKRKVERSGDESSLSSLTKSRRPLKRKQLDDSASQSSSYTSYSSPPSSPIFVPTKRARVGRIDSDSTETGSDTEDGCHHRVRIGERPRSLVEKKRGQKGSSPVSSDSEQSGSSSSKSRKRKFESLREPYKLRHPPSLSPVSEDPLDTRSQSTSGQHHHQRQQNKDTGQVQTQNAKTQDTQSNSDSKLLKKMLSPTTQSSTAPGLGENGGVSVKSGSRLKGGGSGEGSAGGGGSKKKEKVVATRTRAQTKFENITKKTDKKTAKPAPKELVIVWDHNEFKCKFIGCNKSFRKETLLQSHIKHYHTVKPKTPPKMKPPIGTGATITTDKKTLGSPKSPNKSAKATSSSVTSPHSRLSKSPLSPTSPSSQDSLKSPKTKKSKSILSPLPRRNPVRSKLSSEVERRSKSPTESFFEVIKKEQKSSEVLQLLESSTQVQKANIKHLQQQQGSSHLVHGGVERKKTSSVAGHSSQSTDGSKLAQPLKGANSKKLKSGPPIKFPLVEIKAIPRESLPPSPILKQGQQTTAVHRNSTGSRTISFDSTDEMMEIMADKSQEMMSASLGGKHSKGGGGDNDDVVHCICGDDVDEGFMIQCEQCLCWQHGDCIGITKDTLPTKYICCICTNPPGLRNRFKYRFDRGWFNEGSVPSLPGGPKFPHSEAIKKSHDLSATLYQLKKMVHSSEVKLEAASTSSHPYLKQWAKECAHLSKSDIMSYLMTSLLPVSYQPETEGESSSQEKGDGDDSTQGVSPIHEKDITSSQNGVDQPTKECSMNDMVHSQHQPSSSATINVASLHLDPLPVRSSDDPLPTSHSPLSSPLTTDFTPDPKTLKLAPLPPFSSESVHQLTTDRHETKTKDACVYGSKADGSGEPKLASLSSSSSQVTAVAVVESASEGEKDSLGVDREVFNDEFGIQETAVFAVNSNSSKKDDATNEKGRVGSKSSNTVLAVSEINSASPSKLISSSKSAFSLVPRHSTQNSDHPSSSKQTTVSSSKAAAASSADESAVSASQSHALSSLQSSLSSKSTMDTVTLREFAEAFMQGDTTNWFQRMKLFDHIEAVQDKVMAWMEMVDSQLDEMVPPDQLSDGEDLEQLLTGVQETLQQLNNLQQSVT